MIVKTKLSEVQDDLPKNLETVSLRGHGHSSFLYLANKGRAMEISEDNGHLWLEFWERSDDEDAAPVNEMSVESCEQAVKEADRWLR